MSHYAHIHTCTHNATHTGTHTWIHMHMNNFLLASHPLNLALHVYCTCNSGIECPQTKASLFAHISIYPWGACVCKCTCIYMYVLCSDSKAFLVDGGRCWNVAFSPPLVSTCTCTYTPFHSSSSFLPSLSHSVSPSHSPPLSRPTSRPSKGLTQTP